MFSDFGALPNAALRVYRMFTSVVPYAQQYRAKLLIPLRSEGQGDKLGLAVPQRGDLNPPLWELGQIAWFADHWIERNAQRHLGVAADPLAPRRPAARANADALYDSSSVPHDSRWCLDLPAADTPR